MHIFHSGVNAIIALRAECKFCLVAIMHFFHSGLMEFVASWPEGTGFMQAAGQSAKMFSLLRAKTASLLSAKFAHVSIHYLSTTLTT